VLNHNGYSVVSGEWCSWFRKFFKWHHHLVCRQGPWCERCEKVKGAGAGYGRKWSEDAEAISRGKEGRLPVAK